MAPDDKPATPSLSKRLRTYLQETRGNILWDAIKFVWHHRADSLTFLLLGGSTLVALIAGLIQKIRGVPLDWLLLGLIGLTSFISVSIGIILGRRNRGQITHYPNNSSQTPEIVQLEVWDSLRECPDKWLHAFADRDSKEIANAVAVTGIDCRNEISTAVVPYYDFVFAITNVSVYPIIIDKDIKGAISFGTHEFIQKPEIREGSVMCHPRSDMYFIVRQLLYSQEADLISNAEDKENFAFGDLKIIIRGAGQFLERVKAGRLQTSYMVSKGKGRMLKHYI